MTRMRIRKKKIFSLKSSDKIILIVIFVLIGIIFTFNFANKKAFPILLNYATEETKKITSQIINQAINKELTEEIKIDELFIINKNSKEEINTIDFNSAIVNKLLTKVTNSIYLDLKYLEAGRMDLLNYQDDILVEYDDQSVKNGIIFKIPSGAVFHNSFLSNLGPKIPVRMNLVSSVSSNIKTNIKNYGINNALIEVMIEVSLTEQIILPFCSDKTTITSDIPITMKLITGSVPNYYFNGIDKNSASFSLPIS